MRSTSQAATTRDDNRIKEASANIGTGGGWSMGIWLVSWSASITAANRAGAIHPQSPLGCVLAR